MKLFLSVLVAVFVLQAPCISQNLLPPINSGTLASDSDPICPTPWYNNVDFDTTGYIIGDTVNEFTLFDLSGNSFQLSSELNQGKPVLLLAGSLTCPFFRNALTDINTVNSAYSPYINMAIVYVIEAHPTDTSPYSGTINVTNQNINSGVLFPQPTTYLERKNLVDTLYQNYSVNCPLYIDGPCNEWWHTYGPAPLNAYLIDTNGVVIMKHGWFDQFPDDIYCDLDSILGITMPYCGTTSASGSFTLDVIEQNAFGTPGQIIYASADIINPSNDDVLVEVMKIQENYAPGWNSSFCMGICYLNTVDSATILISPGDTVHFSLDFSTSAIPDSSRVRVRFQNVNTPPNEFAGWFRGYTSPTGVDEITPSENISAYPNPVDDAVTIQADPATGVIREVVIYDACGKIQKRIVINSSEPSITIDVSDLSSGIYIVQCLCDEFCPPIRIMKE